MPAFTTVLSAIAEMGGLFAIGWFIRWRGYAKVEELDRTGSLSTRFFYPFLIFHSIIEGFEAQRVRELWILPVLSFGMICAGGLAGMVLRKGLRNRDPDVAKSFVHLCAINNFVYLPLFIIRGSLPPGALADFFVFNLGSTIGFWTVGVLTLGGTPDWKVTAKQLLSAPILSMFLAMGLASCGAKDWLPDVLLAVCRDAGSISVPLILIVIGARLGGALRREYWFDLAFYNIVRLVALPALFIAAIHALPLSGQLRQIAVIVALMPASAMSTVMTRIYGGSTPFAAAATLTSTILCTVTVPLAMWWLAR